jgi:ribosomal protein L11 methyltransferase
MNDSGKEWVALTIRVPQEMVDVVTNFCHERGSTGMVLDESYDAARITAYFPKEHGELIFDELRSYLAQLRELFPDLAEPVHTMESVKTENWAVMWQDNFTSMKIGKRLIVTPPWLHPEPDGRLVVIIEPAEAFGTGTHETTQGCLELLETAVEDLAKNRGDISLLDVGCGSGILAIAGVKLGATRVTGVDNDPVAVESARKNAKLNGVEELIDLACAYVGELNDPADIVTANLDPMTLTTNRDSLTRLFRRFLIVAGVPLDQWDRIKSAFVTDNTFLIREITLREWGCGLFVTKE